MNSTTTGNLRPRKRLNKGKLLLLGAALLALTVTLLYIEENWRGERAWRQFKAEYQATGKTLDWKALIPPEVPDEQNMFAHPVMRDFIRDEVSQLKLGSSGNIQTPSKQRPSTLVFPEALEGTDLLVATISLSTPSAPAASDANIAVVRSPAEAAAEIKKRPTLAFVGAQGIMIVTESLAKAPPLHISLQGDKLPAPAAFDELLKSFTVRHASSNSLEVILTKVYTAESYLATTPSIEKEWAPLAEALQRRYSRIPGDYSTPWKTPIPNFITIRTTALIFAQQAQSYLLLSQPAEALKRLHFIHRLRVMLHAPPETRATALVTSMINVALAGLYKGVIEDGLRLHAWGDAELAQIQKQAADIELIRMVSASFEAELVATTYALENGPFSDLFDSGSKEHKFDLKRHIFDLMPKGWVYQNMVTYASLMDRIVAAQESSLPLLNPQKISQAFELLEDIERPSPFIYLARVAIPNFLKASETAARNQTKLRLAEIACALERYHFSQQQYPDTLDKLVPQYLSTIPREIIAGGQEFKYRRLSNDKFLLYSVGWNEKDEHGRPGLSDGDWVWGSN